MPVLRMTDFKGRIPRLHKRLLPANFAQVAKNTRLEDGSIGPLRNATLAATLASVASSFTRHGGNWIGFTGFVDAIPGPIADDRLYVFGDGQPKMREGGTEYNLALPAPSAGPTVTVTGTWNPESVVEVAGYAYTWVTSYGEESSASPIVNDAFTDTNTATLSGFEAPPANRAVTAMRLYRSQTSASGATDLYFVKELPTATSSYEHDLDTNPLQEIIPSLDYDTPPNSIEGAVGVPNGIIAAWDGREVLFCEPYIPHAWPRKYALKTDYPIVGLASFGSFLAVLTTGTPYIAQGTHPSNMTMEKVEENLPCLSRRGIVDLGYSAAYPSSDGLVLISSQGARLISKTLFTREGWQELQPDTFVADQHRGQYVFSHYNPGSTARLIGIIDLSGDQPFYTTTDAEQACHLWFDITTGNLYYLAGEASGTKIKKWDAGAHLTQTWRSKLHHLTTPLNFGALLVEADDLTGGPPSFTARVYAGGLLRHTITRFNEVERLPAGFLSERWEVEVEGDVAVTSISLAGSPEELVRP